MLTHSNSPSRQGRALRNAERPQSLAALLKCVLLALPFTVLLGALLLLICTALLSLSPNPIRYTRVAALLCLYLTAALGGMLTTRLYGKRAPIPCGLASGVLLMLCLALPALFSPQGAAGTLIVRLLVLPAALVGAVIAARKRKTRPASRRKR
jgi:hypothetical protein